jgi:HSP20 family molecular chaperone IbpA
MSLQPFRYDYPAVPYSASRGYGDELGQFDPYARQVGFGQSNSPQEVTRRMQAQMLQNVHMGGFTPLLNVDLIESPTEFSVHCDLPGVSKEDLGKWV